MKIGLLQSFSSTFGIAAEKTWNEPIVRGLFLALLF